MSLTDEQKKLRMMGVGSSEISALAGVNPYAGPMDVYLAKKGITEQAETEAMARGNWLEPVLAEWYQKTLGVQLERGTTVMREAPLVATPDYLALGENGVDRLVECKTAGLRQRSKWGEPGTDQVPEAYLVQVQWQLLVTLVPLADVVVDLPTEPMPQIYTVHADAELQRGLVEIANRFWRDHILADVPPPPDASEATKRWLRATYPTNLNRVRGTSAEEDKLVAKYAEIRAARKEYEAVEEKLKAELCAAIGEAEGLEGAWGRVTWRQAKPTIKTDWQALACELADKLGVDIKTMTQFDRTVAGSRRFLSHFSEEE